MISSSFFLAPNAINSCPRLGPIKVHLIPWKHSYWLYSTGTRLQLNLDPLSESAGAHKECSSACSKYIYLKDHKQSYSERTINSIFTEIKCTNTQLAKDIFRRRSSQLSLWKVFWSLKLLKLLIGEKFRRGYRSLQDSATGEKLFHHSLSISQHKTEIRPHNLHEYWLHFKWEKTQVLGQKHSWYNPKSLVHSSNIFLQF